jgi:hypothetical protein
MGGSPLAAIFSPISPILFFLALTGTLPDTIVRVNCDVDHAAGGQCVVADGLVDVHVTDGLVSVEPLLAADFGERCGLHKEPFNADCFDQQTRREHTVESGERAAWCDQPWCYVEQANCDAAWRPAQYWSGAGDIAYSYETCGGKNLFSVPESAVLSSFSRRVCLAPQLDGSFFSGNHRRGPPLRGSRCGSSLGETTRRARRCTRASTSSWPRRSRRASTVTRTLDLFDNVNGLRRAQMVAILCGDKCVRPRTCAAVS